MIGRVFLDHQVYQILENITPIMLISSIIFIRESRVQPKVISMGFSNLGNVDVTTFMVPHEKQPLLARPFPFLYTT